MKYRSFGSIILCGLLIFGGQALGQKPAASPKTPVFERISQRELNKVAEKLAATELRQYAYRFFSQTGKSSKERAVPGLFLMRDPAFMKKLQNGFFDDKQSNLIYFGRFENKQKKDVSYSITFAASGDVILAFDIDGNGLADGVVGKSTDGAFWNLLDKKAFAALRECFEARALGEITLCVRDGNPTRPGGGGKGSTPGGGKSAGGSDVERLMDWVANPNCATIPNPLGPVGEPLEEFVERIASEELQEEERQYREQSESLHEDAEQQRGDDGDERLADALDDASQAANNMADAIRNRREAPPELRDKANERLVEASSAYHKAFSRLRTAERQGGRLTGPGARSGGITRPFGPDSESEDPRCAGRRTAIAQGLWFMSKEFCPNRNILDCWERSMDAIRDATGGMCRTEIGPDDNKTMVCEKSDESDTSSPDGPHGGPGPTDGPRPIRVVGGPKLNYSALSLTPIGALVAALCQQAGCPGSPEGLKEARPKKR